MKRFVASLSVSQVSLAIAESSTAKSVLKRATAHKSVIEIANTANRTGQSAQFCSGENTGFPCWLKDGEYTHGCCYVEYLEKHSCDTSRTNSNDHENLKLITNSNDHENCA